jgi:DNA-binding NarL/FixJ family response regulator
MTTMKPDICDTRKLSLKHFGTFLAVNLSEEIVKEKPQILIVDDHALVTAGLQKLLEADFHLLPPVSDGRLALDIVMERRPDVTLMDIAMPSLNGIEATRQLCQKWPGVRIIIVSQQTDRHVIQAAFRAGARGFIPKQAAAVDLLKAISEVLAGHFYIPKDLRGSSRGASANSNLNPSELFGQSLTARQCEVLQLIAEGKAAKEIAWILGISTKTVEFHRAAIVSELGLRTTAELTRYAIEHGIVGSTFPKSSA